MKLKLLILALFVTGICDAQTRTLTGSSGKSIEHYGIRQDVFGTWMGRNSWKDLRDGNWMWAEESGLPKWKNDHFERAVDVGTPLIPTDMPEEINKLLQEVVDGKHDSIYLSLGKNLAKYGTMTVFSRIWWEFNMHPVKQQAQLFVQSWQRAIPLIRKGFMSEAVKGQKLEIVWCTNAGAPDPEPFYPGDAYVDIIGSDTYGMVWGKTNPTKKEVLNRILNDPYMLRWQADFAASHAKPVCIGEWGNVAVKEEGIDDSRGLNDFPEYIDAIYDWAKTNKYGCKYVCYFNLEDGGILTTLDKTPKSLERLRIRAEQARKFRQK
ncbi:glycosyl hydrolase [Pedobacter sp. JY14-1]|uniref:glycosyl hydrolase n=1 Tax=Pedobacter sp. JY14-1 TaxID=3034151 RepID=UPI0023E0DE95|nr:glycosyl hydrolase [Pedobacter sp. JY14-1]